MLVLLAYLETFESMDLNNQYPIQEGAFALLDM
jgi:hypothetical protein